MKSPWLLRILALAGLLLSAYLLTLKLSGRISYLAGCGEGSGCENVLGSRWSQFFYIPVTGFAAGMYLVLLAATWKPSRFVLSALAISLAGAAIWFFGILVFELKAFCPWCSAAHLIGLSCAGILFIKLRRDDSTKGAGRAGVAAGVVALAVLILGQVFGPVPDTHAISAGSSVLQDEGETIHGRGPGRVVQVFGGRKSYNPNTLPHLGRVNAPHVVVKYFDFTCEACLELHRSLETLVRRHPGQFCVIMLPVPLNHACNGSYPPDAEQHEYACELARLGLAGWRARPEAYPEVHEILFTRPVLDAEIAEIAVAQIVGEEALAAAREDPWIDEVLAADINDFRQLSATTVKMPKLVFGKDRVIHGVTKTPEVLLETLEEESGL